MDNGSTGSPSIARLRGEWRLLEQVACLNRGRVTNLSQHGRTFSLVLRGVSAPVRVSPPCDGDPLPVAHTHTLHLAFPEHFPAAPMELRCETPLRHPNVHPWTGFICLWDRHRSSHTIELALHKAVAILCWRTVNRDPVHLMQPEALAAMDHFGNEMQKRWPCLPLTGTPHFHYQPQQPAPDQPRRRRLL